MKLLVADNIFSLQSPKRSDSTIVIDIDTEFDHALDATVWQNR